MLSGLARLARHEQQQDLQLEERLLMQAGVLSVYFLAAVLTGWLFRYRPIAVGILPGSSVLLVAVHGLIYND
jgi:Tfp pilus assembly protein PilN